MKVPVCCISAVGMFIIPVVPMVYCALIPDVIIITQTVNTAFFSLID